MISQASPDIIFLDDIVRFASTFCSCMVGESRIIKRQSECSGRDRLLLWLCNNSELFGPSRDPPLRQISPTFMLCFFHPHGACNSPRCVPARQELPRRTSEHTLTSTVGSLEQLHYARKRGNLRGPDMFEAFDSCPGRDLLVSSSLLLASSNAALPGRTLISGPSLFHHFKPPKALSPARETNKS